MLFTITFSIRWTKVYFSLLFFLYCINSLSTQCLQDCRSSVVFLPSFLPCDTELAFQKLIPLPLCAGCSIIWYWSLCPKLFYLHHWAESSMHLYRVCFLTALVFSDSKAVLSESVLGRLTQFVSALALHSKLKRKSMCWKVYLV